MSDINERARLREKQLHAVIKRPDSQDYVVINQGEEIIFSPSENIGRLEYLRAMAYPELLTGLRLDKSVVKISFR
jgi:hypothetical protein